LWGTLALWSAVLSVHLPDLRSLELLLAVARTGSLGAAGRELGLTQQAVSARIRTVEQLVGLPVVHRGPRGSTLTGAGALLVDWSTRVLTAAEELDAGIASLRKGRNGQLAVGASSTIAEFLLPGWLVRLGTEQEASGRQRPAVRLAVHDSERVGAEVLAGRAQLGFVEGPAVPPGLASSTVATDELVVVVPPGHPWTRRPVDATELAATPLVTLEPGAGPRQAFDRAVAAAAPPRRAQPLMELSAAAAVRSAVLAGRAPGVLSDLAVRDDLVAGRLHRVPVPGLVLTRELRVLRLEGPALDGPAGHLFRIATREPAKP
jgi:molybdate transport repressor ModE-like protein